MTVLGSPVRSATGTASTTGYTSTPRAIWLSGVVCLPTDRDVIVVVFLSVFTSLFSCQKRLLFSSTAGFGIAALLGWEQQSPAPHGSGEGLGVGNGNQRKLDRPDPPYPTLGSPPSPWPAREPRPTSAAALWPGWLQAASLSRCHGSALCCMRAEARGWGWVSVPGQPARCACMLYAQTAVLSWVLAVLGFEGLAFVCFTGSLCPQCGQELRQGALGCQCGFLESAEGMSGSARSSLLLHNKPTLLHLPFCALAAGYGSTKLMLPRSPWFVLIAISKRQFPKL